MIIIISGILFDVLFVMLAFLFQTFIVLYVFVILTKYLQSILNHDGKSPLFCYWKQKCSKKKYSDCILFFFHM